MANKTVEFLKIDILERISGYKLDYRILESIMKDVISKKAINGSECIILDLTPNIQADSIEPKIILDIFDNHKYLFGRICKKKSNNAILQRDYSSLEPAEVFTPAEARRKGIEVFTFFIIDYAKGIISIANAQDAPGANILNYILDNYSSDYVMKFTNIPNQDGINLLYTSTSPEITRLEFEVPSPDPQYLQKILKLNEEEIAYIASSDMMTTTLTLKPSPRKSLEKDQGKVKRIIEILKDRNDNYKHTIIRGKSNEFGNKEFDLHAKFFTYPITIKKNHVVDGKKKEYNLNEITDQFKDGLNQAYYANKELLIALSNRED